MNDQLLQIWCLKRTILTLPSGNRAVIHRVFAMFRIISRFQDDNKMTTKNIATMIMPSMFSVKDSFDFIRGGVQRTKLVELLIEHHEDLFIVIIIFYPFTNFHF